MSLFSIGNFDVISSEGGIRYKGSVATKAELLAKTDMVNGDVWLVVEENKKYIWSESDNQWQVYSDAGITEAKVKEIIESYAYAKQTYVDIGLGTKVNESDIKTVAKTGSYTDLTDKPTIPTKTSELTNDSGFLTEHQSLAGYATESWVESKGYLTEHQDISGKADKTYVDEQVATKNAVSVSATGTSTDVVKYITIDGVEKKIAESVVVTAPTVEFTELPEVVHVGDVLTLEMTPHKGSKELDRIELSHGTEEPKIFSNLVDGQPVSVTYTIEEGQVGQTLTWDAVVYDAESNTGSDTISVEVEEISGPGIGIDGPTTGTVGTELTYTAQLTKGTYDFAKLEWVVNEEVKQTITEGLDEETVYEFKYTPDSVGTKQVKARITDSQGAINADFRDVTITEAEVGWEVGYNRYNDETEEFIEYVKLSEGTADSYIDVEYTYPDEYLYGTTVFKYRKSLDDLTSIRDTMFELLDNFIKSEDSTYKIYTFNDGVGNIGGLYYHFKNTEE